MFEWLKKVSGNFIFYIKNFKNNENYYDTLKGLLLGCSFFFIIGSYSILRPLKSALFLALVGREYLPIAKIISIVILFPCLLLYTKLVDKLRRYQVVYFFLAVYIIGGIITAFLLTHPAWGLSNTSTDPYRFFGWAVYFFIDLYSPLVVSVFWAFANSINNPSEARRHYAFMVSGSKIGGMISTGFAWWFFSWRDGAGCIR